mmetsp:Transcript_28880/g.68097  ORF Transcript_28880/g.68097 Transcript_28880/m.68097 type:complete len:211 (-) Transcript_28880:13-645(-)
MAWRCPPGRNASPSWRRPAALASASRGSSRKTAPACGCATSCSRWRTRATRPRRRRGTSPTTSTRCRPPSPRSKTARSPPAWPWAARTRPCRSRPRRSASRGRGCSPRQSTGRSRRATPWAALTPRAAPGCLSWSLGRPRAHLPGLPRERVRLGSSLAAPCRTSTADVELGATSRSQGPGHPCCTDAVADFFYTKVDSCPSPTASLQVDP